MERRINISLSSLVNGARTAIESGDANKVLFLIDGVEEDDVLTIEKRFREEGIPYHFALDGDFRVNNPLYSKNSTKYYLVFLKEIRPILE